jgi:hypothetical protein
LTPDLARQWQRVFRDTAIVFVGSFILVYETVWAAQVSVPLIGAAITCFGLPPALRLDWRRNGKDTDDR